MKKISAILLSIILFSIPQTSLAATNYDYQVIRQSAYPSTLQAGASTTVWIELKNTGTKNWDSNVRLGSGSSKYGKSHDYSSEFRDPSWRSPNRPASIDKAIVRPGETARFQFSLKAPSTNGTYKAYFTPVVDGISWMKDVGIYWQVTVTGGSSANGFQKITSEAEFKKIIATSSEKQSAGSPVALPTPAPSPTTPSPDSTTRSSETNIQVSGVDEPDMVKLLGENIIYSQKGFFYPYNAKSVGIMPPGQVSEWTKIIDAFPGEAMELKNTINSGGDLLLEKDKNILMVFDGQEITAFDITNTSNPTQKWQVNLDRETYIDTTRATGGLIYVITKRYLNHNTPCRINPLTVNGAPFPIICTDFYRPNRENSRDNLISVFVIDPTDGSIDQTTSFIGESANTTAYMSSNNLYIAQSSVTDYSTIYTQFILENGSQFLPTDLIDHLKKVAGYDLAISTKQAEFDLRINEYLQTLNYDEAEKKRTDMDNAQREYVSARNRQFETTAIAKLNLDSLSLSATGTVPGHLLNQFSMDEYQDHLRVATTIGGRAFWGSSTTNEVTILNSAMQPVGAIAGLGLTERIYSARFTGDKGYLVTFRQIDPFYVLDLSDPSAPKMAGELKIPGFSSYLHVIDSNQVLGVGQENGKVKISLFDVTNPTNPVEKDKYLLDEYWTAITNNHHAFLLDSKHSVFFIPGGNNGYVISYDAAKLTLKKIIDGYGIERAAYINDVVYFISSNKITSYSENTWEKLGEINL